MTEFIIREYRPEDIPVLIELWLESFDDTREFAEGFYRVLPELGGAVVAESDGKIVGASHVLTGQELVKAKGKTTTLGLVYGVSVAKSCRKNGIGEKLVRESMALSKKLGAEIFCCEPANAGLVPWYEKVAGIVPALCREKAIVPAASNGRARAVDAAEYAAKREQLLSGREHVKLSPAALSFEEFMLKCYGGAFYETEGGLATAYLFGTRSMVREVISAGDDASRISAETAAAMGAEDAEFCLPSSEGGAYILSDIPLPQNCIWNLSFS